jgi:hypothetical protein
MTKAEKLLKVFEDDQPPVAANEAPKDLVIHAFDVVDHGPFGSNVVADIEYKGKKYMAIRQGGLGFWAFPERPKMSPEDQKAFDAQLDAAYKEHSEKK